jgi:hypothetical protein
MVKLILVETLNCTLCAASFIKRAHNSKYCSSSCKETASLSKKRDWHLKNKVTENNKSLLRVNKYSIEDKIKIYKRYRSNNNLPLLKERICCICSTVFNARSHNSLSCSKECSLLLKRRNSKSSFKERYQKDTAFRLRSNLRTRLNKALKNNKKSGSVIRNLGCSIAELKTYLESKFQLGMTWDNWSRAGWHIDHIVPLSSFDLTNLEQLKEACHYTNLQPLWANDNLKKANKVQ